MALDHCTLWPDIWFGRNIGHCCLQHDFAYAIGTPAKTAADVALARCVLDTTGNAMLAAIMLIGVTLFGWVFWQQARACSSCVDASS